MSDDEVPGPKVTVVTYFRDNSDGEYKEEVRQEGVQIADLRESIGWWFPGGDSTLDKVVMDGTTYVPKVAPLGSDLWPKGSDTNVKHGSLVSGYKTMFEQEYDDDE